MQAKTTTENNITSAEHKVQGRASAREVGLWESQKPENISIETRVQAVRYTETEWQT